MDFQVLAAWESPMEMELFSATLREREIPHRAHREPDGRLLVEVPADCLAEAREALRQAQALFFGAGSPAVAPPDPAAAGEAARADEADEDDEDEEDEEAPEMGTGFLSPQDALPPVESMRLRQVRVARLLAGVPGLGLGHWYAGQAKQAVYIFLANAAGWLLFFYTGSPWSLALCGGAWLLDMALAPGYVRDENQRALRARQKVAEREAEFLRSLGSGDGRT